MKKIPTIFPDVFVIEPDVYKDGRGFFLESYSYQKYKSFGIDHTFLQDNHAKSKINTVRGLHFALNPGQVKLVRCTQGSIWDVMVDIRPNSPHFKKWHGILLSDSNFLQVLIPVGYAHGYSVLSEMAEVQYKVSDYYNPKREKEVFWNDPSLGIDWKINEPIISNRDKNAPLLEDYLKEHPEPFK